ncbi:type II toxin-antitoxin system VapC family toxin [Agromyces aurantiacus]|uniref:Ribonuclease VapC n=1 Tax=Agromyces aurantiacus TaxID=165814 RepID=A0ABV9R118_9MICO|nr:type II toxin-antitoxin system VapC family toxin [Agromyces aurantiacus]MBM7505945.1 putative nucleic acid-binding protein [Agromyces aurantiacus]
MPRLVVVDASSMAAVLLDADAGEHAVMRGAQLLAPSLLPYEVANVLRRLESAGRLAPDHADQAFRDFTGLDLELWPWPVLADRVWQLRANLSTYDAAYVALAETTGATLLTRDSRLGRAPGPGCTIEVFA